MMTLSDRYRAEMKWTLQPKE